MKACESRRSLAWLGALLVASATAGEDAPLTRTEDATLGRVEITTLPFASKHRLRTATFTPSGKVLVAYMAGDNEDGRQANLAVMDDDGANLRPFFSQRIPPREQDNGIRFMLFPDNQRIFLGDFVLECAPSIDTCERSALLPVDYPPEVAGGDNVSHRWSEIIVAPDNEHVAWTTLLSNYSAVVLTGKLKKDGGVYRIMQPRIVSTLDAFRPDPKHPDGVIPEPVRNGEVKQFVAGGSAISMVGAKARDTADSVIQHLATGEIEQITHNPGYDETTIFSPDERLGIVMTTRFSEQTDLAILGLMPRPYPASLNMGLNMHTYTYSVTGVRKSRSGNIGPALVSIEASKSEPGYRGVNLNTQEEWVYHSPMSWHPGGKKALWVEGRRGEGRSAGGGLRMQVVELPDYEPGATVKARSTPDDIPYASADLSAIEAFLQQSGDIDVRVYGRHSGRIEYRNAGGTIEKLYIDYSDDGEHVYAGSESMHLDPRGNSTYRADIELSGPRPGVMDLQVTFGPLQGELPARLVFAEDEKGKPMSRGYTEYGGRRLEIDSLIP